MYTLKIVSIKKLITAINKEIDTCLTLSEDDLTWGIHRLETAPKGAKLFCVLTDRVPDRLQVTEGCWEINNKSYYLAIPRR